MIILSLDSGIAKTGYSIFEKDKKNPHGYLYITSGLITTSKNLIKEIRLRTLFEKLNKIIKKYHPNKIIFEQLFFLKNQKTAIAVAQAQGAVMLLAAQNKIEVVALTPLQIKQIITGHGTADKISVQKMLGLLLPQVRNITQDDQSDAIACGLAYCCLNENLIK